jgi:hypothetical protein
LRRGKGGLRRRASALLITVMGLQALTPAALEAVEPGEGAAQAQQQNQPPEPSLFPSSREAAQPKKPFRFSDLGLKGTVVLKNFSFFHETPNDSQNWGDEAILELGWKRRLTDWASFNIVGIARQDNRRFTRGIRTRVPDNIVHRRYLDVKEGALTLKTGSAKLDLGKLIYAWGTADAFNPTDNFAPYDYLDIIDRLKMAVYSASLTAPVGPVQVQAIFIPFFTPSRNPLVDSRWTPFGVGAGGIGESVPVDTPIQQRQLPGRDTDNMMYAVRMKTTVSGWDLSASYFQGFEYVPVVRLDQPVAGTVRFTPVYRHMQVPGFDFSTTFEKFEFHGEFALKFEDRDIKDTRFQGSIGLNYTWDDVGMKGIEQVLFVIEHTREKFLSGQNPNFIVDGNFINAFRNALAGHIQLKFSEETQLSFSGTMDFEKAVNYFAQIKLAHKFTDEFHIETGFDNIAGPLDSFWGEWRNNDRFFLFVKYFF